MADRYGHIGQDTLRLAVETLNPKTPKGEKQEQEQQEPETAQLGSGTITADAASSAIH